MQLVIYVTVAQRKSDLFHVLQRSPVQCTELVDTFPSRCHVNQVAWGAYGDAKHQAILWIRARSSADLTSTQPVDRYYIREGCPLFLFNPLVYWRSRFKWNYRWHTCSRLQKYLLRKCTHISMQMEYGTCNAIKPEQRGVPCPLLFCWSRKSLNRRASERWSSSTASSAHEILAQ